MSRESVPHGLNELLLEQACLSECVETTRVENVSVLQAGTQAPGAGRFQPHAIRRVLSEIRDRYAFAVVALPPVFDAGSRLLFASQLDGVLLTVEAERVPTHEIQRGKQELLSAGANVLGVILNKQRRYLPRWLTRSR